MCTASVPQRWMLWIINKLAECEINILTSLLFSSFEIKLQLRVSVYGVVVHRPTSEVILSRCFKHILHCTPLSTSECVCNANWAKTKLPSVNWLRFSWQYTKKVRPVIGSVYAYAAHLWKISSAWSDLMTAYPLWWMLSSKTPHNVNSEYILRVVGPNGDHPTVAIDSRWTTIRATKARLNQTAV